MARRFKLDPTIELNATQTAGIRAEFSLFGKPVQDVIIKMYKIYSAWVSVDPPAETMGKKNSGEQSVGSHQSGLARIPEVLPKKREEVKMLQPIT